MAWLSPLIPFYENNSAFLLFYCLPLLLGPAIQAKSLGTIYHMRMLSGAAQPCDCLAQHSPLMTDPACVRGRSFFPPEWFDGCYLLAVFAVWTDCLLHCRAAGKSGMPEASANLILSLLRSHLSKAALLDTDKDEAVCTHAQPFHTTPSSEL